MTDQGAAKSRRKRSFLVTARETGWYMPGTLVENVEDYEPQKPRNLVPLWVLRKALRELEDEAQRSARPQIRTAPSHTSGSGPADRTNRSSNSRSTARSAASSTRFRSGTPKIRASSVSKASTGRGDRIDLGGAHTAKLSAKKLRSANRRPDSL